MCFKEYEMTNVSRDPISACRDEREYEFEKGENVDKDRRGRLISLKQKIFYCFSFKKDV